MIDAMPLWAAYLLKGISILGMMALPAIVVGRAGRSPYLALLLMIPVINVAAVWAFALTRWPAQDRAPSAARD